MREALQSIIFDPYYHPVWLFAFFSFGAVIGSFLNVCIYRMPLNMSVIRPPSSCMKCKAPLRYYDNIPIVGYFIRQGRCRYCGFPFSMRYAAIELLTALLFIAVYSIYGLQSQTLFWLLFVSVSIVITFIDIDHRIIPNKISLTGIPVGFAAGLVMPEIVDWWFVTPLQSILGIVFGGGVFWLVNIVYFSITGRDGIGLGDVKLLAMLGGFFGWQTVLFTIFFSSLLGSIVGVSVVVLYGRSSRHPIPFGPFIVLGCWISIWWSHSILRWFL